MLKIDGYYWIPFTFERSTNRTGFVQLLTMSYFIAAISNGGGAPEQAYRKMQAAGACPEKPFAGKSDVASHWIFRGCFGKLVDGAFWGCGLLSSLPERV
jgi:hypothetical protein